MAETGRLGYSQTIRVWTGPSECALAAVKPGIHSMRGGGGAETGPLGNCQTIRVWTGPSECALAAFGPGIHSVSAGTPRPLNSPTHKHTHTYPHTFSLPGLQSHPGPAVSLGHRRRRRRRPKARRRISGPVNTPTAPLRRNSVLLRCCRVVLPSPGSGQAAPARLAGAAVSRLPGTAPMYCP